jgi:hypothetical protein
MRRELQQRDPVPHELDKQGGPGEDELTPGPTRSPIAPHPAAREHATQGW